MRKHLSFLVLPIVFFIMIVPAMAADGDLDTNFSADGRIMTDFAGDTDLGLSMAIQDNGRIVVAGYSDNGADNDIAVVRYLSDGSLDTSFSLDGKVTTDTLGTEESGYAVAIQNDGKIVVAGIVENGPNRDFSVLRYNSSGALDTTFDADGHLETDVTGNDDFCYAVAIQDDGKIVAAGPVNSGADWDFAVVRYQSDGTLDNTFDTDGMATTDLTGNDDQVQSVVIQDDGKILVAGYANNGADNDFALVRYLSDGSLDTSFDTDGIVITDLGQFEAGHAVALQDDGKILVAGMLDDGSDQDVLVIRYNADGSLDTTFGTDGHVIMDLASDDEDTYAVAVQMDGKIVVAGYEGSGAGRDFFVVRYLSDGSLDTDFNTDGMVTTDFAGGDTRAKSIALQDDGDIVVAGYAHSGTDYDFAVARYVGDDTPPQVSSTDPAEGAVDQDVGAAVSAEFSESLDDSTVSETSFTLSSPSGDVSGAVTYDQDSRTATFTPDSDLSPNTLYTATLSTAIRDLFGNALATAYSWSFTTGASGESESSGGGCALGAGSDSALWLLLLLGPLAVLIRRGTREN